MRTDRQTDTHTHTHTHRGGEKGRTDMAQIIFAFLNFAKALISTYDLCGRRVIIPNKRP